MMGSPSVGEPIVNMCSYIMLIYSTVRNTKAGRYLSTNNVSKMNNQFPKKL